MFSKHHYLTHDIHKGSRIFVATINDELCGICAVLHFPHPKVKNIIRGHRLVVLPDYQGFGIGWRLMNLVGDILVNEGKRFTITTSSPTLVTKLKESTWRCTQYGRMGSHGKTTTAKGVKVGLFDSSNRVTTSWEYRKGKC